MVDNEINMVDNAILGTTDPEEIYKIITSLLGQLSKAISSIASMWCSRHDAMPLTRWSLQNNPREFNY
ncbi:hypothetical protein EUGRSUZ_A00521 [Eucalyptus grandis]|uniref:Uncharacterized protein n=2 Tax=Eucalyptus grandis TaxID=71139 RepID=A0ACC3M1G7_EUCGR|nr:hypothetical protein EUGRSUZ_A00521 [Eucalyptus grandis]